MYSVRSVPKRRSGIVCPYCLQQAMSYTQKIQNSLQNSVRCGACSRPIRIKMDVFFGIVIMAFGYGIIKLDNISKYLIVFLILSILSFLINTYFTKLATPTGSTWISPRSQIWLHNDDTTPMDVIEKVLVYFFMLSPEDATYVMMQAHTNERSLVTDLPHTEAQTFVNQIHNWLQQQNFSVHFSIIPLVVVEI